jgi:uncharacterized delta-60 repeat protein
MRLALLAVTFSAALAAVAPPALAGEGALDPSFGDRGLLVSPVNLPSPVAEVYSPGISDATQTAAISGDNTAGSHYLRLVLFSASGQPTGAGGFSAPITDNASLNTTLAPVALVRTPNGFFMAVAQYTDRSNDQSRIVLARFKSDGSPDTTFGTQVIPPTPCIDFFGGQDDIPTAAVIGHNDELLVVGRCSTTTVGPDGAPALWEFNEQGTLVSVRTRPVPSGFSNVTDYTATAVAVGPGAIDYLAGDFDATNANGTKVSFTFVGKYVQGSGFVPFGNDTPPGDPVELFSLGATNRAFIGGGNVAGAITVDPATGEPLVAGGANGSGGQAFAVAKFTTTGQPDQTFGTSGQQVIPILPGQNFAQADAIAVRSDGKIWLSGPSFNESATSSGATGLIVARLGPSGQPDGTFGFGNNGQNVYNAPIGDPLGGGLFVQSDGSVVVTGDGFDSNGSNQFVLARVTSAPVTIGSFTLTQSSGSAVISAQHAAGGPSLGILVQRLVHGKPRTIGRVPFGRKPLGHVKIRWNLRVNGHRLRPGLYLITLRALDQNGNVVAITKPHELTIHADCGLDKCRVH